MHLFTPDPSLLSPEGFTPRVPDPTAVPLVPAGSVWGREDLAALRPAALVRVGPPRPAQVVHPGPGLPPVTPGSRLDPDELQLQTVLALSLAGVLVEGASLPGPVRAGLDRDLLALVDQATPESAQDPAVRENLSLLLRRHAWTVAGYPRGVDPTVVVLLPSDCPDQLRQDLEAQTWPARVEVTADDAVAAEEAVAHARDDGAVYCCRLDPGLRYGPHHLADLVHALRHSGAVVAHSPVRYWPWEGGQWLEDDQAALEGLPGHTLVGGSLWYAADGPQVPRSGGYAVSGVNAVPTPGAPPEERRTPHAAPWRLLSRPPALLGWLHEPPREEPMAPPPSYLTRSSSPGSLDLARA